jgi:hypothetical protein
MPYIPKRDRAVYEPILQRLVHRRTFSRPENQSTAERVTTILSSVVGKLVAPQLELDPLLYAIPFLGYSHCCALELVRRVSEPRIRAERQSASWQAWYSEVYQAPDSTERNIFDEETEALVASIGAILPASLEQWAGHLNYLTSRLIALAIRESEASDARIVATTVSDFGTMLFKNALEDRYGCSFKELTVLPAPSDAVTEVLTILHIDVLRVLEGRSAIVQRYWQHNDLIGSLVALSLLLESSGNAIVFDSTLMPSPFSEICATVNLENEVQGILTQISHCCGEHGYSNQECLALAALCLMNVARDWYALHTVPYENLKMETEGDFFQNPLTDDCGKSHGN